MVSVFRRFEPLLVRGNTWHLLADHAHQTRDRLRVPAPGQCISCRASEFQAGWSPRSQYINALDGVGTAQSRDRCGHFPRHAAPLTPRDECLREAQRRHPAENTLSAQIFLLKTFQPVCPEHDLEIERFYCKSGSKKAFSVPRPCQPASCRPCGASIPYPHAAFHPQSSPRPQHHHYLAHCHRSGRLQSPLRRQRPRLPLQQVSGELARSVDSFHRERFS